MRAGWSGGAGLNGIPPALLFSLHWLVTR